MIPNLANLFAFLGANAWSDPNGLNRCVLAIALVGIIVGWMGNEEPGDPIDY